MYFKKIIRLKKKDGGAKKLKNLVVVFINKMNLRKKRYLSADIKGILIVDDEPEFVKTVHRHLKREGFTLYSASDGREARDQIRQKLIEGNLIQLVITDVLMPRMDGIELMKWIKDCYPDISLLAVSGFAETIIARKIIRPEMDEYCQKPFTPNKMMALLDSIHKKRRKFL